MLQLFYPQENSPHFPIAWETRWAPDPVRVLQKSGRYLAVVWRGKVRVTGPDKVITEQAKVDGVVNLIQSRVFVLCFECRVVYN